MVRLGQYVHNTNHQSNVITSLTINMHTYCICIGFLLSSVIYNDYDCVKYEIVIAVQFIDRREMGNSNQFLKGCTVIL